MFQPLTALATQRRLISIMCTLEMAMQLVQKCRLRTHVLLVHSVGITCMYKDSRSKPIICFVLVMVESSTLFLHNNL